MIETAQTVGVTAQNSESAAAGRKKVLHWRQNERMGGMVPVWEAPGSNNAGAKDKVADTLSQAGQGRPQTFDKALAYADTATSKNADNSSEEFGFGDLIDMVNPLQHLPVINYIYREITGDQIKPISEIIGGGLYGGVAGAAAGLINTVVENETGKSVTGNVVAMVTEGQAPHFRSESIDRPEQRLTQATKDIAQQNARSAAVDLPGSVIGFADLGYGKRAVYERAPIADGRTAGTMVRRHEEISAPNPAREPITQVSLSPMPLLERNTYNYND